MQMLFRSDWHWPSFSQVICGDMSDRERLGLPDYFVTRRFESEYPVTYQALRSQSVSKLLEIISDSKSSLLERITAGDILGLIGDPRISIDAPAMVSIAEATVNIGLNFDAVAPTMKRLDGLGLNPLWIEKECPRHQVHLPAYRIACYPVTNSEYRAFLLDTHDPEIPTSWMFRRYPVDRANHPVYTVTSRAAQAYVTWLANRTGRNFRLPSEAEWEYAAAGPEGLEFPWGDAFDADLANTAETGLFTTSAVGVFTGGESVFGLSDMAGNIEEYVADVYAPYPNGMHIVDHLSAMNDQYVVARGGSFARFRDLARTRRRHGQNPQSLTYAMGFRLAETPEIRPPHTLNIPRQ